MKTRFFIITCMMTCALVLFAQTDESMDVIKKQNESVKSFNARFTELQYTKSNQITIDCSGKLYYDAIGRASLVYTDPEGEYIVIDGTYYSAKHNGKKSHSSDKPTFMSQLCNCLLKALAGDVEAIAEDINAKVKSKTDDQYHYLTLKRQTDGKTNKRDIFQIQLRYNKKTSLLAYMYVADGAGNTTTYALTHIQLDMPIPDNVFNKR